MTAQPAFPETPLAQGRAVPVKRPADGTGFRRILENRTSPCKSPVPQETAPAFTLLPPEIPLDFPVPSASRDAALAAYRQIDITVPKAPQIGDMEKYRDDQLLSNPGGDAYYLEKKEVIPDAPEQRSFWGRIGKDISDAVGNVKNFFHDLLFGSKIHYRDNGNRIRTARRRGLIGSVIDFFRDLGSAFGIGSGKRSTASAASGFTGHAGSFFRKLRQAIFGDLIQGVGGSVVHVAEDLVFAGWNFIETLPDATVGTLPGGKGLITAVFDNGQVFLDYLTDILPFGDAWLRVHSMGVDELKAPVLSNIRMQERRPDDVRWRYVRNTPFRKAVETAGSLIMDILTLRVLGHTSLSSEGNRHKH